MNQEHMLNVDYNMGIHIDFVDRDAYLTNPPIYDENNVKKEGQRNDSGAKSSNEELEALRSQLFTEKDKFILSEKSMLDMNQKPKSNVGNKGIRLPSRYVIVDKVHKWGVDIRDPLAVRQLSDAEQSEDEIIMTGSENRQYRDNAIK
jgi:hypothetical protein